MCVCVHVYDLERTFHRLIASSIDFRSGNWSNNGISSRMYSQDWGTEVYKWRRKSEISRISVYYVSRDYDHVTNLFKLHWIYTFNVIWSSVEHVSNHIHTVGIFKLASENFIHKKSVHFSNSSDTKLLEFFHRIPTELT